MTRMQQSGWIGVSLDGHQHGVPTWHVHCLCKATKPARISCETRPTRAPQSRAPCSTLCASIERFMLEAHTIAKWSLGIRPPRWLHHGRGCMGQRRLGPRRVLHAALSCSRGQSGGREGGPFARRAGRAAPGRTTTPLLSQCISGCEVKRTNEGLTCNIWGPVAVLLRPHSQSRRVNGALQIFSVLCAFKTTHWPAAAPLPRHSASV